jgi:hypothetical protein
MLQSSPFVALNMLSIVMFGIGVARLAMINVNTSCKLLNRPQNTWENILHLSWKFVMDGNFIMQKLFVLFPNTARSGSYVNAIKKYSDIAGVSIHTSHYFLNQASQSLIEKSVECLALGNATVQKISQASMRVVSRRTDDVSA